MSGSHGKRETPSPGHYLRRHRGEGFRWMARQLAIVSPIVGVTAKELLGEPGKVEGARLRAVLFPLLHPRPLLRVGNEIGRGAGVVPCHVLGRSLPRNGEAPPARAGGGVTISRGGRAASRSG